MTLLKRLQNDLTCVKWPWIPVKNTENARLINAIVLEEESDEIDGEVTSHFEYYLKSLAALDPQSPALTCFKALPSLSYEDFITLNDIPKPARTFLQTTYAIVQGPITGVAAAFAFGREQLIPKLFEQIMAQSDISHLPALTQFIAYINRHIELDGGTHSNLAEAMFNNLIQTDSDMQIATDAAIRALKARLQLWDAIT